MSVVKDVMSDIKTISEYKEKQAAMRVNDARYNSIVDQQTKLYTEWSRIYDELTKLDAERMEIVNNGQSIRNDMNNFMASHSGVNERRYTDAVSDAGRSIFGKIRTGLASVSNGIETSGKFVASKFNAIRDGVVNGFVNSKDAIVDKSQNVVKSVSGIAGKAASAFINGVSAVKSSPKKAVDSFVRIAEDVGKHVIDFKDNTGAKLQDFGKRSVDSIGSVFDSIKTKTSHIAQGGVAAVKTAFTNGVDFVKDKAERFKDIVAEFGNSAADKVNGFRNDFGSKIYNTEARVFSAIEDIAHKAKTRVESKISPCVDDVQLHEIDM